jgi:hypothetical protein
MSYDLRVVAGSCIDCKVLTEDGVGSVYICKPCQVKHVWPPTVKEIEEENAQLKARILRLEERIAELQGAK